MGIQACLRCIIKNRIVGMASSNVGTHIDRLDYSVTERMLVNSATMKSHHASPSALGKTSPKAWTALSLVLTACRVLLSMATILMAVDIAGLGNACWLFQDDSRTYKARIDYGHFAHKDRLEFSVRDLWLSNDHAISPWEFHFFPQDFLQHFASLEQHHRQDATVAQ